MGSVRREVRIARSADDVWAVLGDPRTIAEWFPGIVEATVDGDTRVITTASGLPMPEKIVTNDPIQRRFQYQVVAPIITHHLGTIDVFDLGDGTSLVSYATDCVPDALALAIGGATGSALHELARLLESGHVFGGASASLDDPADATEGGEA
ncbi:MAG: SRPBCC family protein [Acidimicrobiales bacterium]